ncbi:hypothetical protein BaRGS_00008162 [Batillaria attramentaria]|uniref:Uncharacterized protein n=1 Tax=Batillaria attramentaria TaxID=370345 RepID=A0ABD0LML0_9CAEN
MSPRDNDLISLNAPAKTPRRRPIYLSNAFYLAELTHPSVKRERFRYMASKHLIRCLRFPPVNAGALSESAEVYEHITSTGNYETNWSRR